MSRHPFQFGLIASVLLVIFNSGCSTGQPRSATDLDFHREVRPILERRCFGCHGPSQQLGGLRLDDRSFALSGGVSGKRLDRQPSETNELLRRITTTDPALKMPKEGGSLDESEVGVLRRWVEAGTPWPELVKPSGWDAFREDYAKDLWKRLSVFGGEIKVFLLLALAVSIALGDRIRRQKVSDGGRWSTGWRNRLWRVCQHVSLSLWLAGVLMVIVWDLVEFSMRQATRVADSNDSLRAVADMQNGNATSQTAGKRTPIKPRTSMPFGGMYYRGNDERNEKLFNGGDYRTANLHLSLVDESGKVLQPGDELVGKTLAVKLDIQRASHATPSLFTDAILNDVRLSRQFKDPHSQQLLDEPARMSVIENDQRWSATYRLTDYRGESSIAINDVVYVYANVQPVGDVTTGTIHYGIVCSLKLHNHKLLDNSELWMGPILLPSNFQPIPPGKITLSEWLDIHPIPEITGENTSDPKLLGIPQ